METAGGRSLYQNRAKIISDIFTKRCYRIGGDEFVVIVAGIEQTEFYEKIELLRERMKSVHISIALGFIGAESGESLKEAEKNVCGERTVLPDT